MQTKTFVLGPSRLSQKYALCTLHELCEPERTKKQRRNSPDPLLFSNGPSLNLAGLHQ